MSILRIALAIILAGIVGTIANSIVVAALTDLPFATLALSPGRNAVAIAVAILLPLIYVGLSGARAAVLAIVALAVIPSVLAKLVFGVGAPWLFVLGVNAVYAVAAWATYLALGRPKS
ncbi:MAG: hypothetical protein AAF637_13780 [Pseudomonadota bacterium]